MAPPEGVRGDPPEPPADCPRCPRLVAFRAANRAAHPGWWNRPVPSVGDPAARLLVVGLAPGRTGANRTGRPFAGDAAGLVLMAALARHGFAGAGGGADEASPLADCMITNAVRCVPPGNRPTAAEIAACSGFLAARIAALPRLRVALALGRIAHASVLRALGLVPARHPFDHGAEVRADTRAGGCLVLASYHCSRINTSTGRLTPAMLDAVLQRARSALDA